jgi:hypothetical protein
VNREVAAPLCGSYCYRITYDELRPIHAAVGALLIGLAAVLLMTATGRIAR